MKTTLFAAASLLLLGGCLEQRPRQGDGDSARAPEAGVGDDASPDEPAGGGPAPGDDPAPAPAPDREPDPEPEPDPDPPSDPPVWGDAITPLGDVRPTRSGGRRGPIHIMDLAVVGNVAYLATYSGAFTVDLNDPSAPEQLGDLVGRKLYWVAPTDEGLLTTGRDDGVRRLRLNRGGRWREDAGHAHDDFTPEGLAVSGQRVFIAGQEQGLLIHDLGDLQEVATWGGAPNAIDVAVDSGVAYIGDRERGLVIADVSGVLAGGARGSPIVELGAVALDGGLAQHVEVSPGGRHVYVAAGAVLAVVDVADPAAPVVAAQLRPGGVATAVAADGDLLALANWSDTRLYDVADPASPRLVALEDSVDAAMSVDLQGDLLTVGDWDHLRTFRVDASLQAPELELPRTLTVLGDPDETPVVEAYVVVGNQAEGDAELHVFDVACASDAVTPTMTEATIPPALVAVFPLQVDLVAGGGRNRDREWRTTCAFWSTDPDEPMAEVEIVVNPEGLSLGDPAPDWTLPDLHGELHTLSAHRGKVVVMTIFSSL